uniref:Uncharacterized protein n=1 Tax=Cannabis sativa TaxID=3483 RepID=A0A803PQ65_CANSA
MAKRSHMVSKSWPPLMANVATSNNVRINSSDRGNFRTQGGRAQHDGVQMPPLNRNRENSNASPAYFNHNLSIRLNDHNYLLWRQQILCCHKSSRSITNVLASFFHDRESPNKNSRMQQLESDLEHT